jgi:hypothetical protein
MWYLGVDACMTVLCLRKTQCDEENSAVGSGAGKKQGEMGMVMSCFSGKCNAMNAMRSRVALEEKNADGDACVVISLVFLLVVVLGEKDSSANGRI